MTGFDPLPGADVPRRAAGLSTRFVAVGVMLTLVLVSALAGAAVDRLLLRGHPATMGPGDRGPGRGGPGRGPRPLDDLLTGDLAVTPAQRATIDSAMETQLRDFDAARSTVQPRIDSILQATRTRIDAILTPAQRAAVPDLMGDPGRGMGRGDGRGPGFGPPRGGRRGGPRDGDRGGPRPTPSQR